MLLVLEASLSVAGGTQVVLAFRAEGLSAAPPLQVPPEPPLALSSAIIGVVLVKACRVLV